MLAAQIRQDVIANNLANATNPGFKGDVAVAHAFDDMLLDQVRTGARIGPLSTGTRITEVVTDASQGSLRSTRNPLDVAIGGPGWLNVQTAAGVAYTRNGALTVDGQGRMVTAQGDPVLGTDGGPLVVGSGEVAIDRQGRVSSSGRPVGQIALTALVPESLRKQGGNAVTGTVDPGVAPGTIAQGYLESSNVNAVRQMVDLITNMRTYEANQKVIRALDDTLGGAANQVGKV
jgi:flagellar basal-body rod protein FlgG